jgi:hypothetical protein
MIASRTLKKEEKIKKTKSTYMNMYMNMYQLELIKKAFVGRAILLNFPVKKVVKKLYLPINSNLSINNEHSTSDFCDFCFYHNNSTCHCHSISKL